MNTQVFPLKRPCHGCLVDWVNSANNAFYFAKELVVSEELNDEPNEVRHLAYAKELRLLRP